MRRMDVSVIVLTEKQRFVVMHEAASQFVQLALKPENVAREVVLMSKVDHTLELKLKARQCQPVTVGLKRSCCSCEPLWQATFDLDSQRFGVLSLKYATGRSGIELCQ